MVIDRSSNVTENKEGSAVAEDGEIAMPGTDFQEGHVEADGFRIRYMTAGAGPPLLHLHGAGGLRLTPGHDLLCRRFRVVAFEMPGFGASPENTRTRDMPALAATMARAAAALGCERFNLLGTSFGGKAALWLAVQEPQRVEALVLEAPAAIRPAGSRPPAGSPAEMASRLYAHPERVPPLPPVDPTVRAKTAALVERLRGPDRDADLESRMRELSVPTLVLFGTFDQVIPPDMGHFYKELLPNCSLVFVYDAGHAISTDRPEAFVEVVGDFLERHEAFVISRTATVIHP
jgi:pimeloyl-ACP methyl ester carboxylesterase